MNEQVKSQLAEEELTPAQELSVAFIKIADAMLIFAKYVCQGESFPSTSDDGNEACTAAQAPAPAPESAQPEPIAPTSAPAPAPAPVSKADLRSFLMTKDKDAVKKLFTVLSVTKFSEIPEDRYPDVLTRAQALPDKEAA